MTEFYETTYEFSVKQNADLEGILFGEEDCAPSHAYGPTLRPYHLFHFVTRGEGALEIDGERFILGKGDAFLIPAEMPSYYEASAERPWSYSWAGFTGMRAAAYVGQILDAAPERYVLRGLDTEKYAASIKKAAYLDGTNGENYFRVGAVLYELFSFLASELPGPLQDAHSPSVAARVKFYLDAKYTEKLRLGEVAEKFHIHPNHLSRAFREAFGIAPKPYLEKLKLGKALRMLRETDAPISLIAASLGFEDQHAFSKAFRKSQGVSPTDYRKSGKEK